MKASEFGCSEAHELAITCAKTGWEIIDFTTLAQNESLCQTVLGVIRNSGFPKRMKISPKEAQWWQEYYLDNYNIAADFSELQVPAPADYPTRLIVMHEAIANKCNPIASVYKKRCVDKGFYWRQFNDNLDSVVTRHARSGTYAIRVRDTQEAEFGNVNGENLSSQQIWDRSIATTTLPERLIDGDTYLLKTGKHLDRKVITLCAGSRTASGNVPSVNFDSPSRKVSVSYWYPHYDCDYLRFRLEISRRKDYQSPFCVRELSHPLVIFEISTACSASRR